MAMGPMDQQTSAMESMGHLMGAMGPMPPKGAEMGAMEHHLGTMGSMEHQGARLPLPQALGLVLLTFACLVAVVWLTSWFAPIRFS